MNSHDNYSAVDNKPSQNDDFPDNFDNYDVEFVIQDNKPESLFDISFDQPSEILNESPNESFNKSFNESSNETLNKPSSDSFNESSNESSKEKLSEQSNEQLNEAINETKFVTNADNIDSNIEHLSKNESIVPNKLENDDKYELEVIEINTPDDFSVTNTCLKYVKNPKTVILTTILVTSIVCYLVKTKFFKK